MLHINQCKDQKSLSILDNFGCILDNFGTIFLFNGVLAPKIRFKKATALKRKNDMYITCTWTQSRNEDCTLEIRITTLSN